MGSHSYTAFDGDDRIARGPLAEVALAAKEAIGGKRPHDVLVFDDGSGRVVDLYLAGSPEEVAARYEPEPGDDRAGSEAAKQKEPPRRRGRPKLGVVGREVTLLPRHWEWLATQPGGASAALRRLVEHARKEYAAADRVREARERAYRFLSAMAGDRPGFEEASRALFAGDRTKFEAEIAGWPKDVRDYARELAAGAFRESA